MPNLVKQRYVVSNEVNHTKVINSNERIEQIRRLTEGGGFQKGIFAEKVEVNEEEPETFTDDKAPDSLEALLMDQEEEAAQAPVPADVTAECEALLADARTQAERIIADAKTQAVNECENLKQAAYEQGMEESNAKIEELKTQLNTDYLNKEQTLMEEYNRQMAQLEPDMVDAFIQLIQKILSVDVTDYKMIIIDLIRQAILKMDNPKQFQIYANEEIGAVVKNHLDELRSMIGENASLEVLRDESLLDDQCKIETEYGVYDCGFDIQLKNLLDRMRVLSRED